MSLPLAGQTILVTRPARQIAGLAEPLIELGATVVSLPAIAIAPPEDLSPLQDAVKQIDRYDWVVLTSVNGVEALAQHAVPEAVANRKLAAVGPVTAEAVAKAFRAPDAVPTEALGVRIAEVLGDVRGQRILLARADIARKDLPDALRALGAEVDDVGAYRIVRPHDDCPLPDETPDWIALTSSSGVVGTRDALRDRGKESWMRLAKLASIGPLTADTVRELGYEVAVTADPHTIPGLVDAILQSVMLNPQPEATHA